jgi:hypothetical protein
VHCVRDAAFLLCSMRACRMAMLCDEASSAEPALSPWPATASDEKEDPGCVGVVCAGWLELAGGNVHVVMVAVDVVIVVELLLL